MVERTCHGFETLDLKTFGTRRIFGLVGNFERVVFLNLISMSLQHYILNKDLQKPFQRYLYWEGISSARYIRVIFGFQ